MVASVIGWIVLGLVVGFIGSKLANKGRDAALMDLSLGIVGALTGGWLFKAVGVAGASGFYGWSLLVAAGGAVVFLMAWHALRRPAWHA